LAESLRQAARESAASVCEILLEKTTYPPAKIDQAASGCQSNLMLVRKLAVRWNLPNSNAKEYSAVRNTAVGRAGLTKMVDTKFPLDT
jgi:hypothetical protein